MRERVTNIKILPLTPPSPLLNRFKWIRLSWLFANISSEPWALYSGAKKTPYEALFCRAPRVWLSTTPIPREVFDAVNDEQQFENDLTALTACFER
ncbi:hypothetical protein NPIL_652191 [Nephila pilipes]|uniref:Uncharacterized protein n=1 Tax=Nephila pilipes TaxID=299642 RepID=A0A8X6MBS1_NEPPI|nr:hypothetical protein NPIL_652191 [Nephila pilipes]